MVAGRRGVNRRPYHHKNQTSPTKLPAAPEPVRLDQDPLTAPGPYCRGRSPSPSPTATPATPPPPTRCNPTREHRPRRRVPGGRPRTGRPERLRPPAEPERERPREEVLGAGLDMDEVRAGGHRRGGRGNHGDARKAPSRPSSRSRPPPRPADQPRPHRHQSVECPMAQHLGRISGRGRLVRPGRADQEHRPGTGMGQGAARTSAAPAHRVGRVTRPDNLPLSFGQTP